MRTQLMRQVRRAARAWVTQTVLAAGLGIGLAGCATHPQAVRPGRPGRNQTAWQELPAGAVGIITTSSLPLFRVVYPANRDDAVEQAGSRGFWLGGEPNNEGVRCVLSIPLFGLGALGPMAAASVGAQLVTSFRSVPDQELFAAIVSFGRAEERLNFQAQLAREVGARLGPKLGRPLVVVPKPNPPIDPAELRKMASFQAGTLAWLPDNVTGDAYLASHGIETILELRIRNAGLLGSSGANPGLSLGVEAEATLIRRRDGMVLARASAAYASPPRKFPRWAAREGRLLQEEFVHGCGQLGQELARGLLASFDGPAPSTTPGQLVQTP